MINKCIKGIDKWMTEINRQINTSYNVILIDTID